jgi:hypothetical protein
MLKHVVCLCAAGSLLVVSAATTSTSASIGFVKSTGQFRMDGSAVSGNGTIFEGTLIETAATRSIIQLSSAEITLAPASRLRVYRDRAILEKGIGSVKDGARYRIEAASMRVAPSSRSSVVQVELTGARFITVAAHGGPAEVRTSSDVLAASVIPGMAMSFEPQAAPVSAVKMTGVIEFRDNAYFLTDATTKVTVQLQGAGLARDVGKTVEIKGNSVPGATPAGGATQVVQVVALKQLAAGSAAAAASGGAGTGLSAVAIGAIVGGVAVVGALGGLAAAGGFSGSSSVSNP